MKKYSIIFFIKQSLNGLFMNSIMSITSVFILTSCLILTGCFSLLAININLNMQQIDSLNKIVFFIDTNYESEEDIERIKESIQELDNTESIRFISKDEALQNLKEKYEAFAGLFEDKELFSKVIKDNPLSHSIEIEYKNIDEVGTLDYQLRCIKGCGKIKNQLDIADFIQNLKNIVMLVFVWFLAILFIIAIFIILNTVRLSVHSRRTEISIMRYIGATNFFIIIPFLLEGVIIGLVSAIIAYFAQSYIYTGLVTTLIKMNTWLKFVPFDDVNSILLIGSVLIGVICGLFGSGISSRRYLKA